MLTMKPAHGPQAVSEPAASVKWPKPRVPANAAVVAPISAAAPMTTMAMPIRRSAFS